MKQKEISQFYEKIVPENQTCNENRNNPTPTTCSQIEAKNVPKKNQIMQNFLDRKASKNNMKTAKNTSGKGKFNQAMMILLRFGASVKKLQRTFVKHALKICANFA